MLQQMAGDIEIAVQRRVEHSVPVVVAHHKHGTIPADAGIIHQHANPVFRMSGLPLLQRCLNGLRV